MTYYVLDHAKAILYSKRTNMNDNDSEVSDKPKLPCPPAVCSGPRPFFAHKKDSLITRGCMPVIRYFILFYVL